MALLKASTTLRLACSLALSAAMAVVMLHMPNTTSTDIAHPPTLRFFMRPPLESAANSARS